MAKAKIEFIATELRDMYVCAFFTMREGDVIELDDSDRSQALCIESLLTTMPDSFKDVSTSKVKANVKWTDLPVEMDPVKEVESFLVKYRSDPVFRRQAQSRGVRVLAIGEADELGVA